MNNLAYFTIACTSVLVIGCSDNPTNADVDSQTQSSQELSPEFARLALVNMIEGAGPNALLDANTVNTINNNNHSIITLKRSNAVVKDNANSNYYLIGDWTCDLEGKYFWKSVKISGLHYYIEGEFYVSTDRIWIAKLVKITESHRPD